MKKDERTEDLNPLNSEIDEKVRKMMDPSIPDVVENIPKNSIKQINVQEPIEQEQPKKTKKDEAKALPSKGRKVIVPISHDGENETKNTAPLLEADEEPETGPTIKIDENNDDKTKEDVAEKLNEAIADLDKKPKKLENKENETATDKETEKIEKEAEITEDEDKLKTPEVIDSPETDKAVKDIVAKESDDLLDIDDAVKANDEENVVKKNKSRFSLKALLKSKKTLKVFIFTAVVSLIGIFIYPATRYFALNIVGIRSTSTVTILDNSTQLPLRNVTVSIGSNSATTDDKGTAKLTNLKLGKANLKIERIAFAKIDKTIIVGWGSNPLGTISIDPTGAQFVFELTDLLSGKAIPDAIAFGLDSDAKGDEKGLITLTVPSTDKTEFDVEISAENYKTEKITVSLNTKESTKLKMVPSKKHVYISKRSGKFDIYSAYINGSDEKLILAGSGNEKEDLTLLPHQTKNFAAYVSTRAGKKNSDGFILNDLVILDLSSGKTTPVISAERIQLLGWIGDRLIFVTISSGESAASASRNRLLSYNLEDSKIAELAKSNYFNDLMIVRGSVYFAPSSAIAGGSPAQFFKISADGSNLKTLHSQEVWSIIRTSYDVLNLSVGQKWYEYKIGDEKVIKIENAPANTTSRVYINNPEALKSAWIDQRDGKGTLIVYDVNAKTEVTLQALSGIKLPITWLNNSTMVYRLETKNETADYAISIDGGTALKIKDVSKSSGIDNWYYY